MKFQLNPWQESAVGKACEGARGIVMILVITALVSSLAHAAENEDDDQTPPLPNAIAEVARKYAGVTEWRGFFDSATSGSAAKNVGNFSRSRQFEARSRGHFTLKISSDGWDPKRGDFRWGGDNNEESGEATGSENDQWSERDTGTGTSTEWRSELSGTVPLFAVSFEINLLKQGGNVHLGFTPNDKYLKRTRTGQAVVSLSSGDGQRRHGTQSIDEVTPGVPDLPMIRTGFAIDRENAIRERDVVRNGPGVLVFGYQHDDADHNDGSNAPRKTHRSRIILFPVYDDLEVEVTIDGYAAWRPLGSIKKPTEPGNHLVARATLKSKTGQVKKLPEVKRFKFQLLDTSREPGVCLNWPLAAKDTDPDLRLAAEGGGALSEADQKLALANPPRNDQEQPYAEARIDSYDFGARASLLVVCELEDGREIIGLMKDEGGAQDFVRLPKMNGPDWIAEAWRKEKKVEKHTALADDEKVEGQKHNGDGYTLYEEYRGWAVNGSHVEGDPERKDFFVLNLIGAEGRAGIGLFEALSKLRVHSKLRRSEMSQTARLMNGNRRDGPHRVAQHGVWVKTFTRAKLGDNGADTPMTKAGVAGRPSITKGVGILARGDAESIFNKPFNLPARDTILAYDRAIAHELLHSVGVEHHGPDDVKRYALKFIPPNVPANKIGRPHYQTGDGTAFTVLQEDGHDLAASVYVQYSEVMAKFGPMMMGMLLDLWSKGPAGSADPKVARERAEDSLRGSMEHIYEQKGIVGMEHAEHSGDQDCVMRYYFARFYEAKSAKNTLYIVAPGTERIGIDICHAGTGTGINAPSHKPQSRYGNAAAGEGDCFSQICPNDAIPPRKVK